MDNVLNEVDGPLLNGTHKEIKYAVYIRTTFHKTNAGHAHILSVANNALMVRTVLNELDGASLNATLEEQIKYATIIYAQTSFRKIIQRRACAYPIRCEQ